MTHPDHVLVFHNVLNSRYLIGEALIKYTVFWVSQLLGVYYYHIIQY